MELNLKSFTFDFLFNNHEEVWIILCTQFNVYGNCLYSVHKVLTVGFIGTLGFKKTDFKL